MKKLLFFIISLMAFEANAQWKVDTIRLPEDANGMKYKLLVNKPGKRAEIGQLLSLHMVAVAENGKEIKNSYKEKGGKQILFPVKIPTFRSDIYASVMKMSEGDSGIFRMDADSMYLTVFRKEKPAFVTAGSELTFFLKVHKIIKDPAAYFDSLKAASVTKMDPARMEKEEKEIQNWLIQNGHKEKAERTQSGVYIIEKKAGKGNPPTKGQTVVMNFDCKLLNGTIVESSYDLGKPFHCVIGADEVIAGWEEGVRRLAKGGEAIIVIPSHMGYRHLQKGAIKPHSILVIEVKIESIR